MNNTTATLYQIGQSVSPNFATRDDLREGTIVDIIPPIGTAGEWSYYVEWSNGMEGGGWTDANLNGRKK